MNAEYRIPHGLQCAAAAEVSPFNFSLLTSNTSCAKVGPMCGNLRSDLSKSLQLPTSNTITNPNLKLPFNFQLQTPTPTPISTSLYLQISNTSRHQGPGAFLSDSWKMS
mmetsp:Transcript_60767/g.128621  ORF Transcript_60767/g.128621 Transcript_60767/m.128621 type:complete len:109 (-) Transcript_60767:1190-1516(-)